MAEDKEKGDDEKGQGFKVVDRRRFTAEGDARVAEKEASPPKVESSSAAAATVSVEAKREVAGEALKAEPRGEPYEPQPEMSFTAFIVSLATQAMWQLGEAEPPPGLNVPKDKLAAKQTIDLLQMLEDKTKGNLSEQEEQALEEILHSLRLMFLRA